MTHSSDGFKEMNGRVSGISVKAYLELTPYFRSCIRRGDDAKEVWMYSSY